MDEIKNGGRQARADHAPWTPLNNVDQRFKTPVVNQAQRELLALIEYCAPRERQSRLASLVHALCDFSEQFWVRQSPTDEQIDELLENIHGRAFPDRMSMSGADVRQRERELIRAFVR
jgi:hypothetical protein